MGACNHQFFLDKKGTSFREIARVRFVFFPPFSELFSVRKLVSDPCFPCLKVKEIVQFIGHFAGNLLENYSDYHKLDHKLGHKLAT